MYGCTSGRPTAPAAFLGRPSRLPQPLILYHCDGNAGGADVLRYGY